MATELPEDRRRRPRERSIVLVGFMGVGKTSVGRDLARLLGRPFVDTDDEVEIRTGRTIQELFAESEQSFRALERQCVLAALELAPCVIAMGGGAFLQPGLADVLLARTVVVHLDLSWPALLPRIPALTAGRPLLAGRRPEQIHELFLHRAAAYRRAHIQIAADGRSTIELAIEIGEVLRAAGPQ